MDLRQRRLHLITEHQAMEKYDPYWKAEAAAGRKISERPIAFLCDDEVRLFDECAEKAHAGLKKFLELVEADPDQTEAMASQPTFVAAVKLARLYTTNPATTTPAWCIPQQRWNSISYALAYAGLDVIMTDGTRFG